MSIITVTDDGDSGAGTLRQAIADAVDGDTIDFDESIILITLTSDELLLDQPITLTISGPISGPADLIITRDSGASPFRIFHITAGLITFSNLTISNGNATDGGGVYADATTIFDTCIITGNTALQGGGLLAHGAVTLIDCIINNNTLVDQAEAPDPRGAGIYVTNGTTIDIITSIISENSITSTGHNAAGAGIYNNSSLTITDSTIDNNSIVAVDNTGFGAGILNADYLTLQNCTISNNTIEDDESGNGGGGGICNYAEISQLFIRTCTISSNTISEKGGGILNLNGVIEITNTTITNNTTSLPGTIGGGIHNTEIGIYIDNTIVALNGDFDIVNTEAPENIANLVGYNLFITDRISGFTPNITDVIVDADDFEIGPLADNGGPTYTHRLFTGNPAINAGDNTGASEFDQRGFTRIIATTIDIGAYEYDPATEPSPYVVFPVSISYNLIHEIRLNNFINTFGDGYEHRVNNNDAFGDRSNGLGGQSTYKGTNAFKINLTNMIHTNESLTARANIFWKFYQDRLGGFEPFYFYNPIEASSIDLTGVSTTGRYLVRFEDHSLSREAFTTRLYNAGIGLVEVRE